MADLDEILAAIQALSDRVAALEDDLPFDGGPLSYGKESLDSVDWVAQWAGLGHGFKAQSGDGLAAFLGALCDEADALAQALENPWADVFGAISMLSCHYVAEVSPSYMNDVEWERFIGVVYNYLLAEQNEAGESEGVTFWELLEAIAYGIDNVLRYGPLVVEYRSEHRISGLRPGLAVASVLSPLALLLRRLAVYNGERSGMGEDGRTIIVPSDPPPGGWPWSMPDA